MGRPFVGREAFRMEMWREMVVGPVINIGY